MATLLDAVAGPADSPAILVPGQPTEVITYGRLRHDVQSVQQTLASIGIGQGCAVSIALPNSYEFIVAFLAITQQRAAAAPLNPAYQADEFEFYIGDLGSALAIVPHGSYAQDMAIVQAARKYKAAIAECRLHQGRVALDVKESGSGSRPATSSGQSAQTPEPDDVALVLHTSGTTGRPKAVRAITHGARDTLTRCNRFLYLIET